MSASPSPRATSRLSANEAQSRAADPSASAWVSANAGSGKTTVLVNRVIRLLLAGTPPGRILCLTFTKAAASEMTNRLFNQLSTWAVCDVDQLRAEIEALLGRRVKSADLNAARRLFAHALETPGGLKIQTIHAFCEALLHRFPVEANVPAGFEVLEEAAARELRAQAISQVIAAAAGGINDTWKNALDVVASHAGETRFDELIGAVLDQRGRLTAFISAHGGLAPGLDALRERLGLQPDDDEVSLEAEIAGSGGVDEDMLRAMIPIVQASSANDQKLAARITQLLNASTNEMRLPACREIFHTGQGGQGTPRKNLLTKKIVEQHPEFAAYLEAEQARVVPLFARLTAFIQWRATAALLTLGDAIQAAYEAIKARRGRLDYDDLIAETEQLLSATGHAWVLYKLDGGIDHILIDEAQDTSPGQWRVVRDLAEEFFSGLGARETDRTVFAVGDEKQSIFSFQGADPAMFDEMRRYFARRADDARKEFAGVPLTISYRSTETVLWAVDKVFADPRASQGLTADDQVAAHQASRLGFTGRVEIWATEKPDDNARGDPWDAPLDWQSAESPQIRLTRRIADTIAGWLETGASSLTEDRPIRADDILILVRRRGRFVEGMVRALKERGVPVAGADRMTLSTQIAVMDLVALAEAALLPEDDLTLATVLKGPLIGLTEEQLFDLAYDREGSLWRALRAAAAGRDETLSAITQAHATLSGWFARAHALPPFEFFSNVLSRGQGRMLLARRLGPEINDPLDEFLNLALNYERTGAASLQGFLAWFAATGAEIKRDLDARRNQVRIMTIHGAKGLEAPIVILPDTCSLPDSAKIAQLLFLEDPDAPAEAAGLPVWRLNQSMEAPPVTQARMRAEQATLEEYHRLLYVAMTRASDHLIVAGYETRKNACPEGCWYDLISTALKPEMEADPDADGAPERWVRQAGGAPPLTPSHDPPLKDATAPLPGWAGKQAAAEPPVMTFQSPSRLMRPETGRPVFAGASAGTGAAGAENASFEARRRGVIIHKLLQGLAGAVLQDATPASRIAAARRMLDVMARDLDQAARANILDEIARIVETAETARLFDLPGRAEAPVAGQITLGDGASKPIFGRIDRLVFDGNMAVIVDFKTDRRVPDTAASMPAGYLVQLAAYRAVVGRLYPQKPVSCAVLWTAKPLLMEVPSALLEQVFTPRE